MGIFDAILGTNTSASSNGALPGTLAGLWNTNDAANAVLKSATTDANTALTSNTGHALDALTGGYGEALGSVGSYGAQGQQQLASRTDQAAGTALAGNGAYQPYASSGGAASSMLADALGLNGAGGNAAARSAFTTSPGYQFQVDQATGGAERAAAAGGMLGSGSTLDAITRLGSHLADQEYQGFLSNLSGLGTQGLNAASGMAANDRAVAGYQSTAGTTGATLLNNTGSTLGTIGASGANQQANAYSLLGQLLSSNDTALGRNISSNATNTAAEASGLVTGAAQRQDAATNANNGVFSKLIGGALSLPMGGGSSLGGKLLSSAFQF